MINLENNKESFIGWKKETELYKEKVRNFILDSKNKNYDHLTEFHISGMNSVILESIMKGEVLPEEVEVYYKNNKVEKIHVLYNSEGKGHYIDIYLEGRALEDFLK